MQPLRLLSYNIRYESPKDIDGRWSDRRPSLVALLKFHRPDIFGLQEVTPNQVNDIAADLRGEYRWVGIPREEKGTGELTPIFYRNDRFRLLETKTRWLSDTPDEPGSLGWDADAPRTLVSAHLAERRYGGGHRGGSEPPGAARGAQQTPGNAPGDPGRIAGDPGHAPADPGAAPAIRVYNTHFDNVGSEALERSLDLVEALLAGEGTDGEGGRSEWIFMGDLNFTPADRHYRRLCTIAADARSCTEEPHYGPEYTYIGPGFRVSESRGTWYDYIFLAPDVRVLRHAALTDSLHGRYPSDHLPVYAEVVLSGEGAGSGVPLR